MILAINGKTEYRIEGEYEFAIKEFCDLFNKLTGAVLERAQEDSDKLIKLGGVKPKDKGEDAYVIRTEGDNLILSGNTNRGILYAIYTFFERYAGCRWFTSDCEYVPRKDEFTIPEINIDESPFFWYRETFYKDAFEPSFALRNKLNGHHMQLEREHGGKFEYGLGFVHTFHTIIPQEEYFKTHPEYFPMIDGERTTGPHHQICLSNPDVLKITIEKVKKAFDENPNVKIVSVSQNDTFEEGNQCRCDQCSAIEEEEGSPAGNVIRFVNSVADAIKDEYPDKYIDTLAYRYTRKAPLKTKPRDNVIVRLCTIECCFSHPITTCDQVNDKGVHRNGSFIEDIVAWSKIANNIFIWDYIVNFLNYLTPYPNLYALQKNMQFFAEHNVKGVFSQGCGEIKFSEYAHLRAYVIAKLLEDPYCDVNLIIDEFMYGYYQNAAAPLRKYIDVLNKKAEEENFHFGLYDDPNRDFLTKEFVDYADSLFDMAERMADDETILYRVRRTRMSLRYAKLFLMDGSLEERRRELEKFFEDLRYFKIESLLERGNLDSSYERMRQIVTPEDVERK
ncbi:MAG TPA: DUF4838 domain-containing protein [Clostridiaceae bacterium]|jgi:hypothetical protein|nr:DUF4838 domain-containing protein [Clostridiaceae bacterium]